MMIAARVFAAVLHVQTGQDVNIQTRCWTTDAWKETVSNICFMDVSMIDKEPTPFMIDAARKQKAYEAARRKWKKAHPPVSREAIDAAYGDKPRQTD